MEEAPETDVVTDEPIFTPVAAEETVHGISAAQGERMAAALTAAVTEEGYEVTGVETDEG